MSNERNMEVLPPYDWQLIVTEGHEIGLRVRTVGRMLNGAAWGLGFVALVALGAGVLSSGTGPRERPNALIRALYTDPNTATVLSDGSRVSYKLSWMSDISLPKASMPVARYAELVRAAAIDVGTHGADTSAYTAIPAYESKQALAESDYPHITRPAAVFSDKHLGALGSGVVAIPAAGSPLANRAVVAVAANVDGILTIAGVGQSGCSTLIGKPIDGCGKVNDLDALAAFKPAAQ